MKKALSFIILTVVVAVFLSGMACLVTGALVSPKWLSLIEPYVCPPGTEIQSEQTRSSYHRPGESSVSISCVSGNVEQDATFQALLALSILFFVPLWLVTAVLTLVGWLLTWWRQRTAPAQAAAQVSEQTVGDAGGIPDVLQGQRQEGGGMQRLKELKEMLDAGLITLEEYEAKKNEILTEL